jgi:DNA-directed RNA polymerase specialized sigma24 family protein
VLEPGGDAGGGTIEHLLSRMRSGDREAAATFITRYDARLRRRIRGKLTPAMRRLFDSQDIVSTVGRRLDLYVLSGRLEAASEGQLWALVLRMANNAVIDKSRVFRRLQKVEDEDSPLAQELLKRLREAERESDERIVIEIERAMGLLDDVIDRQILHLWLAGSRHSEIALDVDIAPTAVRKRWQKIRSTLQARFAAEMRG